MNNTIENAIGDLLFWSNALAELRLKGDINPVFNAQHAQEQLNSATRKLVLTIGAFGGASPQTVPNAQIFAATWDFYQNGHITFDHQMVVSYSDIAASALGDLIASADLIRTPFEKTLAFRAIFMEHQRSVAAQCRLSAVH